MASHDTEITLGTGKMLALFFGLEALNGAFFGMGYSLRLATTHPALSMDPSQSTTSALRPTPMKSGSQAANTQQENGNLTFYKAVEQKDANAQLPPAKDTNASSEAASNAPPDTKSTEAKPAAD